MFVGVITIDSDASEFGALESEGDQEEEAQEEYIEGMNNFVICVLCLFSIGGVVFFSIFFIQFFRWLLRNKSCAKIRLNTELIN